MESGKNTRRRLSATSTATNDNEASTELLPRERDRDDTSHEPSSSSNFGHQEDGSLRDSSKWLRPLGVLFLVLLLAAMAFSSFPTLSQLATKSRAADKPQTAIKDEDASQQQMLGIQIHPYDHVSRPSKTITHHWNITSDYRSPDGIKKQVFLVNGQFPGPTIECRSGDRLIIHVTNSLSSREGVSIHWHGLHMRNANSMDGAVGFTQCPIASGTTFTYEFNVEKHQAGTFWWHAHSQVQRGDGMYGGLVVHKPSRIDSELGVYGSEREILLMIGDWYHRTSSDVLSWYMSTRGFGNEPVPDSLLVNGAGKFICSMAVPARPVDCVDIRDEDVLSILGHDKSTGPIRLRVINVGSLAGFTIGLSSGNFTPLTVDGDFPIAGELSNSLGVLYPGERVDMLLHSVVSASNDLPKLHINLDPENFKYPNPAMRPNQSFPLVSSAQVSSEEIKMHEIEQRMHFDLATATAPETHDYGDHLEEVAEQTILLYTKTQKLAKLSNHPTGFINRTSWAPQTSPPFPLLSLPRNQWDANQLVPWIPSSAESPSWVEIIVNNLDDGAHPFHLHGNDFYVLASHRSEHGWGSYSPYETSGSSSIKPVLNLVNPVKKDTVSVPRRGYVVLRFRADNPGIWMFHCHVLFHQASGMAMGVLVDENYEYSQVDPMAKLLCG
ncbi:Oxidoreductase [Lachnellula hyalina]|uniref:Oxidoreductase n=1 Tax=Lachnellula hyalina TaxID=1316788 RepID=A0A8H8TXS7_9HELO|nr:Oxidoreductase [Lachnellula hyalina]TVY24202.1 Oxidoreductase [Lachnellula hyalina]